MQARLTAKIEGIPTVHDLRQHAATRRHITGMQVTFSAPMVAVASVTLNSQAATQMPLSGELT